MVCVGVRRWRKFQILFVFGHTWPRLSVTREGTFERQAGRERIPFWCARCSNVSQSVGLCTVFAGHVIG